MYGIGLGIAMQAAPLYLSEMSPPFLRAGAASVIKLAVILGLIISYTVGGLLKNPYEG
ncbi:unnamed protein product, partial [Discosporangium mesarthrocarpum]